MSKKQQLTMEGLVEFNGDATGNILVADIFENCALDGTPLSEDLEEGPIIRLQSWDARPGHPHRHQTAETFRGRMVRVTIETID